MSTRRHARLRGFTLIELMVVLAIIVVLAMVAVPSFVSFQRNSQLTSVANALLASVNAARGEAMKRNQTAFVVPNSGTDWSSGWKVFVSRPGYTVSGGSMTSIASDGTAEVGTTNSAASSTFDSTRDLLVQTFPAAPGYLTFSTSDPSGNTITGIRFDGSGYSRPVGNGGGFQTLTLKISRNDTSSAQQSSETRIVVVANSGRARVCKPVSSTDGNCKPTSTQ